MCTAGTLGERRCATSEMPVAKKRGSCSAPGICLRNSGLNSPNTVETLTPTFSNTRPRMTDMVPPPRSSPPGPASRCHALRSKRPGARSRCVPESSSSRRSNSAQMPVAQILEPDARLFLALGERGVVGQRGGGFSRRAHRISGLAKGLAQYHHGGQRDIVTAAMFRVSRSAVRASTLQNTMRKRLIRP